MTMARVIGMKIKLRNGDKVKLVATVDPGITPGRYKSMLNIGGKMVKSRSSLAMPLPLALSYSRMFRV